jgi:integrase
MNQPAFISGLSQAMDDFAAFKKAHGHDYTSGAAALRHFDRFLFRAGYDRTDITADIIGRYTAGMRHLAANTQYNRLSAVRVFSRWLSQLVTGSAVAEHIPVRRPTLPRYYLYSGGEIAALIRTARQAGGNPGTVGAACHATLIGLLYVTGLRIGEALALDIGDIDLAGRHITVRRGKLGKARHVALSETGAAAFGRYLDARLGVLPHERDAPLFINAMRGRMSYDTACKKFRSIVRTLGIAACAGLSPRLHDLRHTYACDCLRRWYEDGEDVNARLPALATAMGHVNIQDTQIYLHVTAQLFQLAADRFHQTFTINTQGAHP